MKHSCSGAGAFSSCFGLGAGTTWTPTVNHLSNTWPGAPRESTLHTEHIKTECRRLWAETIPETHHCATMHSSQTFRVLIRTSQLSVNTPSRTKQVSLRERSEAGCQTTNDLTSSARPRAHQMGQSDTRPCDHEGGAGHLLLLGNLLMWQRMWVCGKRDENPETL